MIKYLGKKLKIKYTFILNLYKKLMTVYYNLNNYNGY
jgi:hypothetical protein